MTYKDDTSVFSLVCIFDSHIRSSSSNDSEWCQLMHNVHLLKCWVIAIVQHLIICKSSIAVEIGRRKKKGQFSIVTLFCGRSKGLLSNKLT